MRKPRGPTRENAQTRAFLRLEVKWLSGGVVDLGRRAGVPTPANRAACDILALHADGTR